MSEDENKSSSGFFAGISEDKMLGVLLLSLGAVLVVGLLVWRSLGGADVAETLPPSVKQSVWFDENGLVRSESSPQLAEVKAADAPKPQVSSIAEGVSGEVDAPVEQTAVAAAPQRPVPNHEKPRYMVQLASFSQFENADALAKRVAKAAPTVEVSKQARASGTLNVVRVPIYGSRAEAEQMAQTLKAKFALAPLVISNQ